MSGTKGWICGCCVLLSCFLSISLVSAEEQSGTLPWEYWKDPGVLARIPAGLRALYTSSHAEGNGAFDRSSEGDTRFLKIINGEAVIFEAEGAGILSRIWLTQGDGSAGPLERGIRLLVRIDGRSEPEIDVPLADMFRGRDIFSWRPLLLDFRRHGGGNVCRLPISFRSGCRVSLIGAEKSKIWYQVGGMSWEGADRLPAKAFEEDARGLAHLLKHAGYDPWPAGSGSTRHGVLYLADGSPQQIFMLEGEGEMTAMLLRLPRERWPDVELRLEFDGIETARMRLPWFFGVGGPMCRAPLSLFIGGRGELLYSYFPMPFRRRARISLRLHSGPPLDVEYSLRCQPGRPAADAGLFGAVAIDATGKSAGVSPELFHIEGRSRLAGLFLSVRGSGGAWDFLEGDEEFLLDGEQTASWRGTGVEDFFGGGFYFHGTSGEPEPFFGSLSGLSCVRTSKPQFAAMYRLMPASGPVAEKRLILRWEGGSRGETPTRWRGVAWLYRRENEIAGDTDQRR